MGYDGHFWISGLVDFLKVQALLTERDIAPRSMLELGAASGRVLRHFAVHADVDVIWGTDLTVHNDDTWRALGRSLDDPDNRLIQALLRSDPDTHRKLEGPIPAGRTVHRFRNDGPYRANVFVSNDHIEQVWGRFFHIDEILLCHHGLQSVVVLRRRA